MRPLGCSTSCRLTLDEGHLAAFRWQPLNRRVLEPACRPRSGRGEDRCEVTGFTH